MYPRKLFFKRFFHSILIQMYLVKYMYFLILVQQNDVKRFSYFRHSKYRSMCNSNEILLLCWYVVFRLYIDFMILRKRAILLSFFVDYYGLSFLFIAVWYHNAFSWNSFLATFQACLDVDKQYLWYSVKSDYKKVSMIRFSPAVRPKVFISQQCCSLLVL